MNELIIWHDFEFTTVCKGKIDLPYTLDCRGGQFCLYTLYIRLCINSDIWFGNIFCEWALRKFSSWVKIVEGGVYFRG